MSIDQAIMLNFPLEAVEAIAWHVESRVLERMANERSPWMTAPQAAEHMAAPLSRVRKLTSAGKLPHYKEGGRVLYRRDEIDAYIRDEMSVQVAGGRRVR